MPIQSYYCFFPKSQYEVELAYLSEDVDSDLKSLRPWPRRRHCFGCKSEYVSMSNLGYSRLKAEP